MLGYQLDDGSQTFTEWEMVENHQRSMAQNGCLKVLGGGLYTFLGCFNKNVLSFWRIEKNS